MKRLTLIVPIKRLSAQRRVAELTKRKHVGDGLELSSKNLFSTNRRPFSATFSQEHRYRGFVVYSDMVETMVSSRDTSLFSP